MDNHYRLKVKVDTQREADLLKLIVHIYNITGSPYIRGYIKLELERAFKRLFCEKDLFTLGYEIKEGEEDGNK